MNSKANEHNALVPRDPWLTDEEKQAIIAFHDKFPLEGYRRLTFMMIDADVAAASASRVYRVLSRAGLLDRWNPRPTKKGTDSPMEISSRCRTRCAKIPQSRDRCDDRRWPHPLVRNTQADSEWFETAGYLGYTWHARHTDLGCQG